MYPSGRMSRAAAGGAAQRAVMMSDNQELRHALTTWFGAPRPS
jgi:hypothetical protein